MHLVKPCAAVMLSCVALDVPAGAASPATDCRDAAAAFERSERLPSGLLLAIGQVESGRADPATGRIEPWPWTTNASGQGHYFAAVDDAIAWVTAEQAVGQQSIDVGCFQVNLMYHPDAFATLAEAFDPTANARYAAGFLNRLYERSGSWPQAIAWYHSADPLEGSRYSDRVMAAWGGGGAPAAVPVAIVLHTADPVVVRISAAASRVRVEVPGSMTIGAAVRPGLPRIFTPSR